MPSYDAMHATRRHARDSQGWLARLRRWLNITAAADTRQGMRRQDGSLHTESHGQLLALPPASFSAAGPANSTGIRREDNVVDFPGPNRNVLVRLAHELGARIDDSAALCSDEEGDPVLLLLTTGSAPRLWVDSTSHVEVCEVRSIFRVVLGENLDTRVSLETGEFDRVKQFIWEYLLATRGRDVEVGELP